MNSNGEEKELSNGKISVWWDIDECRVPRNCDPGLIAVNIASAVKKKNYCGPITIRAYGDDERVPFPVQEALNETGISFNIVPSCLQNGVHARILVDMLFWAADNPAPATCLLICGDQDLFGSALNQLRLRNYDILLAQPEHCRISYLIYAAHHVWCWTRLCQGGLPLTQAEFALLESILTQPPTYDILNNPAPTRNKVQRELSLGTQMGHKRGKRARDIDDSEYIAYSSRRKH